MEEYNSLLLGDGDCTDRPCFLFLFPFLHPLASSIAKIVSSAPHVDGQGFIYSNDRCRESMQL